jgi:hypothetical protein
MMYVASQIVIWMVIALLVGFSLGWVSRGRRSAPVRKKRRF